jgi:hypothetical protein
MKRALVLSALVLLAACGRSEEEAAPVAPTPTPTVVAAGAALALDPLQNGDGQVVADGMSNVGGCAFYDKDGRHLLSVGIPDNYDLAVGAGGDAIGVARIKGEAIKLTAVKADAGYVEGGPQLTGGGFTLTVMRAEGEGKPLDREEVEYAADLVVADGGGDSHTYTPGGWRCGV